ncbi:hypothetical protein GLYMA_01G072950v4 [Glycine max]|nr:hypothetical protein GLYMA_01G072950v4 [Glycine max]KAH1162036.1 hypothetical protein GYH30_000778 [Glycine max]
MYILVLLILNGCQTLRTSKSRVLHMMNVYNVYFGAEADPPQNSITRCQIK